MVLIYKVWLLGPMREKTANHELKAKEANS